MNILLIAGHGAGDPGAIGNGYKEADLVRELLSKIKSILDPFSNVTVFDTTKNMYRHLKSGKTFDFSPFDYILELHFNAGISENSKNNGITEGFHRKMKLIQRMAYGYRNFQNYRLRVLVLCGVFH